MQLFAMVDLSLHSVPFRSYDYREQHRYVPLCIVVIDSFCAQEFNDDNPLFHLLLIIASKVEVSSPLIIRVLIEPLRCADREGRLLNPGHLRAHCLVDELDGD
jgi:hypothetical protein